MTTELRTSTRPPVADRGRSFWPAALIVVVAVGVFHASTIRPGHVWLDDFASYVAHTRNIVEGRAYEDTGYVYNPAHPVAGPRAYPPVFPLMLVPTYLAQGLDLDAMKLALVVVFVALLLAIVALIRRAHPPWVALAVVAAIGFNPFMWSFKDNVLSDLPFALFVVLTLLAVERTRTRAPDAAAGLVIGALMFLAYGTRTVGALLVPAFLAFLVVKDGRIPRYAVIAVATFAGGAVAQAMLVPGGSGYTDQLALVSPRLVAVNAWRYLRALEGLTANGAVALAATALSVLVTGLAVAGYLSRLTRERLSMAEIFVPLYLVAVAAWPSFQSLRFLIPVLPFYALYAVLGAGVLARLVRRPSLARPALVAAGIALVASYASLYPRLDYGPLPEGVGVAATREMFAFVRTETTPDAVVVFQRPKALALYTGRRATAYAPWWTDDQLQGYLHRVGARYLVDGRVDHGFLAGFVTRNPDAVTLVFSNAEHRVYRLER